MICTCPVCGKMYEVLWPHLWAYKRNGLYICSWKCIRADEKRKEGVSEMSGKTKVPDEAKKKAIQAALDGKDPYEYLSPYTGNPKAMWTYIKMMVKQKDPELYAKIPDLRNLKQVRQKLEDAIAQVPEPTLADAMAGMQEATDTFFGECEKMGLMKAEEPEEPEEPKITQPVVYDGMTVREIEGGFGRYRRSDVHGSIYIDFEYTEGADVISLTDKQWRSFMVELIHASQILGVKL